MKVKTLIKKLEKMPPDFDVTYLTGPGQWGKVVGVHVPLGTKQDHEIVIDVIEDEKSWDNPPY